jgi:hypothetical protein
MVSIRRKNQATKGTTAHGGELPEEQPSAKGPTPQQPDRVKMADLAMSEQRMVTIEDGMNNLKEMVKRERKAWQKKQQGFQIILINLGLGQ